MSAPGDADKAGGGKRRRFGPEFIPLNISAPFIRRPVATTLLTIAIALAGMVAFGLLPVAPLPEVDFPVVVVRARMPGASPETMAATVATPLERALGRIAGVTEMTSSSSLGSSNVILQFDLDRDIDGAAGAGCSFRSSPWRNARSARRRSSGGCAASCPPSRVCRFFCNRPRTS